MKVRYQFAQKNPTGWQEIDAKDWHTLPSLPIPDKGQLGALNNVPGWIRNVNVQGITNEGFDHVAIEPITIGNDEGIKMYSWNDDLDDAHVEGFEDWINEPHAIVWTILPLAPDPKLGMAINTRQSCIRYATGLRYENLLASPPQNTTVRPWSEFIPPAENITRHGVWLDDAKLKEHIDKAPHHEWGWMHWCEHLPETEIETETEYTHEKQTRILPKARQKLKEQRAQGRYKQAEHTTTYYQQNTSRAAGYITATNENAFETSTAASGTQTVTTNSGIVEAWCFCTPANEPNSADWPSGTFHVQVNCTSASATSKYGCGGLGALLGGNGWVRLDSTLATALDSVSNSLGSAEFSGTGLKLTTPTTTWDSAAGSASDCFSIRVGAQGSNHGDAVTLQFNTTDSYADGPWGSAAVAVFVPSIVLPLMGAGV